MIIYEGAGVRAELTHTPAFILIAYGVYRLLNTYTEYSSTAVVLHTYIYICILYRVYESSTELVNIFCTTNTCCYFIFIFYYRSQQQQCCPGLCATSIYRCSFISWLPGVLLPLRWATLQPYLTFISRAATYIPLITSYFGRSTSKREA